MKVPKTITMDWVAHFIMTLERTQSCDLEKVGWTGTTNWALDLYRKKNEAIELTILAYGKRKIYTFFI